MVRGRGRGKVRGRVRGRDRVRVRGHLPLVVARVWVGLPHNPNPR